MGDSLALLRPDHEYKCTICSLPNAGTCNQCQSANYCSPECQQTDWPSHSLLCSQLSIFRHKPSQWHIRAIFFPPNHISPTFIWVRYTVKADSAGTMVHKSILQEHLGGEPDDYESTSFQQNRLRERNFQNTIEVTCRGSADIDGSEVNKSIVHVTNDAAACEWRGEIVAMKKRGLGRTQQVFMDMDLQDYRDVIDYFVLYGDDSRADQDAADYVRPGKVRGVKINCVGDQRTFGAERFSAVDVPAGHPVFYEPVSQISTFVGLPIRTRRCPPDQLWADDNSYTPYMNIPAPFLHQATDDDSDAPWGLVPLHWQGDIGTVLVVRSDGQDVTPQQVEDLCDFCQFKMRPMFSNGRGFGHVHMTRGEVMGCMTEEGFAEFGVFMRAVRARLKERERQLLRERELLDFPNRVA